MSLADLQAALQQQADQHGNVITITAAVIQSASLEPRDQFDALIARYLRLANGLSVTVDQHIPDPAGNTLALSGQLSCLGLSGVTASVEFIQQNGNSQDGPVDLSLSIGLGDGWYFSRSFPLAAGYPFDDLTLNDACYVFTTNPQDSYTWQQQTIPARQGLNFVAALAMGGPFGVLASILESGSQTDTITFCGTIDPSPLGSNGLGIPLMALAGAIDSAVNAIPNYFPLTDPRVTLEASQDDDGNSQYWLSFVTTLTIDGQPYGDFTTALLRGSSTFTFSFIPSQPITVETIIKLMGGEDFTKAIPSELESVFDAVGLTGLGVAVNCETLEVGWISANIGSSGKPWQMGQFVIDEITLGYTLLDPFGNRQSLFSFDATSEIFPDVFKGQFLVEIAYDLSSSALDVAAGFTGSVSLSDLVKGLSGGSVDIANLGFDVTFETFGITFDKAGDGNYEYTLYGDANVTLQVTVLGGTPEASFSVYVDSATKSYTIAGVLMIGANSFQAEVDLTQDQKQFVAAWNAVGGKPLGIADLVAELGLPAPSIPAGLDLDLVAASFTYDFTNTILVLEADSATYGQAVFVARKAPALPPGDGDAIAVRQAANGAHTAHALQRGSPAEGADPPGWQFFFGLDVDQTIDLTNLPLIKSVLPADETVAIEKIQVIVASARLDATAAAQINALIQGAGSGGIPYPTVPSAGMDAGVSLSMVFCAGSFETPLTLSTSSGNGNQGGGPSTALAVAPAGSAMVPAATGSDGTVWYNLQKTFGPVSFQKVGIRYQDSVLYVLMNASLAAGGLTISVLGLGVGSPLTSFKPQFTIDGLAITFVEGPVDISGGLVGTVDPLNFYGELKLAFPEVTISALGAYAQVDGHPSFFLYAVLDYPIGGPAFFFVTGLAAGFGFNRKLLIPAVGGVSTFPLVQWAMGTNAPAMNPGGDIGTQVTQVLTTLATSGVVAPSIGDYWLALGIRFTSFDLLDSFALLTITFGTRFEIDLLGLSRLTLPPAPAPPVALVELELKASFSPDTGLLALEGQLTPKSYVLSPDCHLTGGFAFYLWFAGEHAGEFVVTLGGYSPRFSPPAYYPQVPRLGLNWQVVPELSIKGDLYFALTSSAVMAGGGMSAVWQSGDIRAWFDVEADFLMVFTPFHYYLSAGIHLGASFRVNLLFTKTTVTIHLGVDVEIWGPAFAGKATIDLSIISFTISFGASNQSTQTTIAWPDFVGQLMPSAQAPTPAAGMLRSRTARAPLRELSSAAQDPAPPSVVQITISNGLLKTLSDKEGDLNFIVSGEQFELTTQTAIPAKAFSFSPNLQLAPDDQQPHDAGGQVILPNTDFGVGPTGTDSSSFQSTHSITLDSAEASEFLAVRVLGNVPKAFWETRSFDQHGVPQNVDPVNDTTIDDALVGYRVIPYVTPPDHTLPIQIEYLRYTIDPALQQFSWSDATYPTTDSFSNETVASTIDAPLADTNRPTLLNAMIDAGLPVSSTVDVGDLANQATNYLLAQPLLRLLGEQKETVGVA